MWHIQLCFFLCHQLFTYFLCKISLLFNHIMSSSGVVLREGRVPWVHHWGRLATSLFWKVSPFSGSFNGYDTVCNQFPMETSSPDDLLVLALKMQIFFNIKTLFQTFQNDPQIPHFPHKNPSFSQKPKFLVCFACQNFKFIIFWEFVT